jgi:signal transduction histidine kinase/ActR/RegA family two-component response regulator
VQRIIKGLYEAYRAHHDMERPLLEWIGVVGFLAFPLFYLLRKSAALPPLYDDLELRLVASFLCLLLGLRRFWPARLKHWYIGYSYFTVFYCLSFLLSFTMLKNQGGTPSVVNMVMGAILIILLADWRNTVVMLMAGYASSILAYWATEPVLHVPSEFVMSAAGSILVVVAGALSHYGQKRAELERMRRVYSGLAGSIAHEMRTPLAQVQQTLERMDAYLARAGTGQPPALARQQAMDLGEVVAQGRHAVARGLQAITLTLQQLNGKAIDAERFTRISAARCVREAVDEYAYEDLRERSRISVLVLEDFAFRGDETAFVLVIFNLLKNALYYAPVRPDLAITITIERTPVQRVTVRDTGPGIPPEVLGRLFEEFQSAGKSEGTGLGLAFCRRAMRAFGGEITCRSAVGEFTEFTLAFPVLAAQVPAASTPTLVPTAAARAALAGQTVLVVDDSAFNRAIVKARLRELELVAVEAAHGGEALRLLDEGLRPAAILMDMEMPGLSGIEATRALRSRPGPANAIPVLALSANDLPEWRRGALEAGMNGYLTKPLQPELLGAELARVLDLPLAPAPPEPVAGPGHIAST